MSRNCYMSILKPLGMSSALLGFEEQEDCWEILWRLMRNQEHPVTQQKWTQYSCQEQVSPRNWKKKVHVIKFMWLFVSSGSFCCFCLFIFLEGFGPLSLSTEARSLRASLTLICEVAWRKWAWSFYISESRGWRRLSPSLVRKYRALLQGSAYCSLSSSRLAMLWSCLFPSHASVFPDLSAGTSPLPET